MKTPTKQYIKKAQERLDSVVSLCPRTESQRILKYLVIDLINKIKSQHRQIEQLKRDNR